MILAGNADNSSSTKRADCSGILTSQGYNHLQSTAGCTISGTSAQLSALVNNSGQEAKRR